MPRGAAPATVVLLLAVLLGWLVPQAAPPVEGTGVAVVAAPGGPEVARGASAPSPQTVDVVTSDGRAPWSSSAGAPVADDAGRVTVAEPAGGRLVAGTRAELRNEPARTSATTRAPPDGVRR